MKRDCTIRVAKTKALISFAVTAKLICVFVFAYAKSRFCHNEAQIKINIEYAFLGAHWNCLGMEILMIAHNGVFLHKNLGLCGEIS